jgi:hypothetical protein
MPVIVSKIRKDLEFAATSVRGNHAPIMSAVSIAATISRKAVVKSVRLLMHAAEAVAEARMQRAAIEAELYLNRYKHQSKNDDDLPVVR